MKLSVKHFTITSSFVYCVCSIFLFISCTTRSARRLELLADDVEVHNYGKIIETIRNNPDLYGKLNRFLFWFDQGVLFHYDNAYDSSLVYLKFAEKELEELYAVSITNEAASLLTNDNVRPYRARRYEQILLHQFLACNYLAKGEIDEALVESRKVQLVFDRFKSQDKNKDRYNDDGMSHFISAIAYDAVNENDNAVISLYKAAKSYRNSPVPLPSLVNDIAYYRLLDDEREQDIQELGLEPIHERDHIPGLENNQSEIIVIGYSGKGSILGETLFWGTYVVDGLLLGHYRNPNGDTSTFSMPAPALPRKENKSTGSGEKENGDELQSGATFHIKFTLPTPVPRESKTDHFIIAANDQKTKSVELTDLNLLLRKDIEDNYSRIIVRTAIRVVLRTIAAQKTKEKLQTESPIVNLLLNFGTDALYDQLEKADTRLCFFLPKSIHIARIPVEPGTYQVHADAISKNGSIVSGHDWQNITVAAGEKKFLFYTEMK